MYVDHAATTPLRPEVLEAMLPYLRQEFGNPSSLHAPGRRAAQAVRQARLDLAELLGCAPEELVFTASGSEGANLAIRGAAHAAGRGRVVTSRIDHPAALETCRRLPGLSCVEVDVDANGTIDLEQLERAVDDDTVLVSIGYANNEVGTIQPLQDVVRIAHARGALIHTDAVQAAGLLPLDVDALGVDFVSIAAHKFYGPKGVGVLFARAGTRLSPQILGGGQERGRRSGTENVAGVVGMAVALSLAYSQLPETRAQLRALAGRLLEELTERVAGCRVTGHPTQRLPGHASFAFNDIEIASVLIGLDKQDIYASSGSACTSRSTEPSHVLVAMGVPREALFGALRLSFGLGNTSADVNVLLDAIPPLVAAARRAPAIA
jgi:cysteine desulfurase